jgi:hypothetical protein
MENNGEKRKKEEKKTGHLKKRKGSFHLFFSFQGQ